MQVPNKAKLILIKGEGLDGISYHLNSTEHVAGRQQGAILFPDDTWLSPRHANFFYRDNKLFVRDEDSLNGVYIRVREPATLRSGQMFMCGEQVFNVENAEALSEGPESDGTYFYASPTKNWSFGVVQLLPNGIEGIVVHNSSGKVVIGREDCDMNFIQDRFMSTKHAEIEGGSGKFTLTDLGSQNGTFVRVDQEHELVHGDYVFLGKQLLRVEVTP
jgi:pSer/pThr/pTyr-binding forkhead associated (FHA) protein